MGCVGRHAAEAVCGAPAVTAVTAMTEEEHGLSRRRLSKQAGACIRFPAGTMRMATAVVGIDPIVLAGPFFRKNIVKGLTVGAVKG